MDNHYTGATVNHAATSSHFNSEAWESFSWRKAKELFQGDIGVPVNWLAGPFPAATRSSWNVCLNHAGSDVGISQGGIGAAIASVSGVRMPVNFRPTVAGAGGVDAYNRGAVRSTLRDQAHAAIATALQADRALVEEMGKAIATVLAATGVTGGGIDLLGSVAAAYPPQPHPRVPCRHPNPHPQPSRRRTAPRSGHIRQNHHHYPAAGWASTTSACFRCSAASPSA